MNCKNCVISLIVVPEVAEDTLTTSSHLEKSIHDDEKHMTAA